LEFATGRGRSDLNIFPIQSLVTCTAIFAALRVHLGSVIAPICPQFLHKVKQKDSNRIRLKYPHLFLMASK